MGEPASANAPHPHHSFFMTYMILLVNIMLFISVAAYDGLSWETFGVGPRLETLVLFGAKQNGLIAEWQLERLLLPMFLHANFVHLAFNMYAFFQVGRYLEFMVGPYTLLVVYVISGFVGNIWSFAFIPSLGNSMHVFAPTETHAVLSVGASGSLFGILFFLFVLQKYQQHLAAELGEHEPKTNLGSLILVNALLTFVVPNIDWACHMGGAFAGAILGIAFALRHDRIRRHLMAARFLSFGQKIPSPVFWKRQAYWYLLLAVSSLTLLSSLPKVGAAERALGRGILGAAKEKYDERELDYISEFDAMLTNSKAETNPERLVEGAMLLHRDGQFHAAHKVYVVAKFMHEMKLGSAEFLSSSNALFLNEAIQLAARSRPLPDEIATTLPSDKHPDVEFCRRPATIFKTLGFFPLAGMLMDCAYSLNPQDLSLASETVEIFWRSSRQKALFTFLDYVDSEDELGWTKKQRPKNKKKTAKPSEKAAPKPKPRPTATSIDI